jgi:hypothetical protein
MAMHPSTFDYLNPTDDQKAAMAEVRAAAKAFCDVLEAKLPDGPDKTFVIRAHRSNAMWANVSIVREHDGSPRISVAEKAAAAARKAAWDHSNGRGGNT